MKNSEQPINPTILRKIGQNVYRVASEKDIREGQFLSSHLGLTKRELTNFMQHGHYGNNEHHPMVAEIAVRCADELLKQLDVNTND